MSKQNKPKTGKKERKKIKKDWYKGGLKPGTFGYMRLYFTTTPRRLITSLWRKLFNLMRYPWNFRQQIRSV